MVPAAPLLPATTMERPAAGHDRVVATAGAVVDVVVALGAVDAVDAVVVVDTPLDDDEPHPPSESAATTTAAAARVPGATADRPAGLRS